MSNIEYSVITSDVIKSFDCIKISLFLPVLSLNCLSSVRTYLPGTVLQWCRLLKRCPNLPSRHCVTVVQAV